MTNQINNQSIIPSTDVIQLTSTLKMTTAQVVETSVTINNNSPIQDYVHPDDQNQSTFQINILLPYLSCYEKKDLRSFLSLCSTVCTMLLRIYKELTKNLAYGRLDCIAGLSINFVIYFIQHFLFFKFFPYMSKTVFDKEFTTHSIRRSASRWAAQCGADDSTIKRAGRWCVEGFYINVRFFISLTIESYTPNLCCPEHCVV